MKKSAKSVKAVKNGKTNERRRVYKRSEEKDQSVQVKKLQEELRASAERRRQYKDAGAVEQEMLEAVNYNKIVEKMAQLEDTEKLKVTLKAELQAELKASAERRKQYKNAGAYEQEAAEMANYSAIVMKINDLNEGKMPVSNVKTTSNSNLNKPANATRDEELNAETMAYLHNQKNDEYYNSYAAKKELEEAKKVRTPKKITPENGDNSGTNNKPPKESKIKSFVIVAIDKAKGIGVFLKDGLRKIPELLKLEDDDIFEDVGDPILAGQVQGIMEEERKDQAYNLRQLVKESEEQDLAKRREKEPALAAMHKRREEKRNTAPLPNLKAEEGKKSWELPNGEKLKVVTGTNQVSQEAAINEALASYDRDSRYPTGSRRTGGRELVEE